MLHTVSLKENHVFRRLYHRGATAGNRLLVVYCLRNGTGHSRLGLTVSAKLGHAVERNRMRRRRARPRGGLSWILSAFPLAMCWNSSMDS